MKKYTGPKVLPTVDIAAINLEDDMLVLVRRPNEPLWRFPGGFADVNCESYENDALRELKEETNIYGNNIEYIGSTCIDDPRYKKSKDKIKTMFFAVTKWNGEFNAVDDLKGGEIKLLDAHTVTPEMLMPEHRVLLTMLLNWLQW
jgi:bifunctional NMN adenylyltransferase/nudix hydrolase